ncbi:MAG: lipoyl synthase, partial [Caldilinea sp.]|nr:lipoyl synthase [Caldilinea sp.]
EVLTPDFNDKDFALELCMSGRPHIFNHNIETVERLTALVRSRAKYQRSLTVLKKAKAIAGGKVVTKSGLMLGLGEKEEEVLQAMDDLRAHDVDIMTIGQYLQPSRFHLPIERYYTPDEFARLKEEGEVRGFKWMESGPLVRSSYHADGQAHLSPRKL